MNHDEWHVLDMSQTFSSTDFSKLPVRLRWGPGVSSPCILNVLFLFRVFFVEFQPNPPLSLLFPYTTAMALQGLAGC